MVVVRVGLYSQTWNSDEIKNENIMWQASCHVCAYVCVTRVYKIHYEVFNPWSCLMIHTWTTFKGKNPKFNFLLLHQLYFSHMLLTCCKVCTNFSHGTVSFLYDTICFSHGPIHFSYALFYTVCTLSVQFEFISYNRWSITFLKKPRTQEF